MIYDLIEHIASFMDGIVSILFLILMLGWRREIKRFMMIPFLVLQYASAQYLSSYPLSQIVVMICINIFFSIVCLQGKIFEKYTWSIVVIAVYVIVNATIMPLISTIIDIDISEIIESGYFVRVLYLVICQMLHLLCISCILAFLKNEFYLKRREWVLVVLILASNTFVILGDMKINLELTLSHRVQLLMLMFTLLLLFIFFGCIYMVYRISVMNKKSNSAQLAQIQLDNQIEMINTVHEMQTQIRIVKHDMKHYADLWLTLIKSGKWEEVEEQIQIYLNHTGQKMGNINYIQGNECINAVLFEKNERCKELQIPITYEITTSFHKNTEENIAIILSNLIDNAIQREMIESNKEISIMIFMQNDIRNLIVSNNISKPVLKENPKLFTTKDDKKMHGIGILSTKEIVKNLGGTIDILEENNQFVVHISGI